MKKTKILIVDDHAIVLDGLKSLLSKFEGIEIAGVASNGEEGLKQLAQTKAELVITDLNMPGMDGLEFIKTVRNDFPPTKIIVLSLHDEPHFIRNIMKQRVQGYILKNDASSELVEAVERILDGKTFFSSKINQALMEQLNEPNCEKLLTERELEIIKLIAKEFSNKQIADQLFISERTVETHRKNIFRKTNSNNIVGLIKYAYNNNMIE
ncbi:response regulator transcription factor [Draconibacterium sp.]|jgi:DNA-binding NarL/FixJ family response regulator